MFGGSNSGGVAGGGGGGVVGLVAGAQISIDSTDPAHPIVSFAAFQVLATFTNDVNEFLEGGTVDDINFAWTYNRNGDDPTSQSINQGIGGLATNLRAYNLGPAAGIVDTTTWTLSAVGDDGNPSNRATTITKKQAYYFGVDQAIINTGAGIEAAFAGSEALGTARGRTYNFDASAGGGNNYLYIAYPAIWGDPASTQLGVGNNQLDFNDFTQVNDDITNSEGFTREYIILRTNNSYNSANLNWTIA